MAEILLRVVDKVNPDSPVLDAACTKMGDIIAIQPDGWAWGTQERLNPDWRIVTISGLPAVEGDALLAPELPPDTTRVYQMLRKRQMRLNLSLLPLAAFNRLVRVPRDDSGLSITLAQARAIRELKQRLAEPDAIGPSSNTIG